MATNNFKPFATAANANVTAQADWEALPALLSGFMAGKASSAQVNKAIRQASFIAAALAQYTANKSGLDVLDDGDLNGFISKMGTAFGKDFQALDATLTALAGLATGANKLPYFTGNDTAALTDLTQVGRDIIGKSTIADILTYLGLSDAFLIKDKYLSASLNLNTLGGDGKYGIYAQPVTNNASLSKNYPTQEAGSLLVSPAAYNGLQVYITLSGLIWSRYSLDSTNTNWSQWVRQALKSELDDGLALKFDSSSLSTTGKALVAKSTVADMRTYLQLFSAAQRDVGTGANQIPDMNAFSGSIVSKGYQKFPGGLIIQWGINNASVGGTSGNGEDVSYAIPFPNGCLSLTATFDNGGPVIPAAAASFVDNVYFKLRCSEASGSYIFRWIALGF
ncbi:TPA: pyocin knob domain-containing protein [Escherichia coli]